MKTKRCASGFQRYHYLLSDGILLQLILLRVDILYTYIHSTSFITTYLLTSLVSDVEYNYSPLFVLVTYSNGLLFL